MRVMGPRYVLGVIWASAAVAVVCSAQQGVPALVSVGIVGPVAGIAPPNAAPVVFDGTILADQLLPTDQFPPDAPAQLLKVLAGFGPKIVN